MKGMLMLMILEVETVMPRSRGYGDVTATIIYRSKILSHIYAKHQYRQELEFKNMCCIIHSTYEYNYKVITGCDTILQEYYITDRRNYENTKSYTSINSTKLLMSHIRKTREPNREPGRTGSQTVCR